MTRILVTGATGNIGTHVVRALRDRGESVRAFVRDAERAADRLGPDVELAVGDFADPGSVRRAMHGVDRVLLTAADGPDHVAHETTVIDAAAADWVQRIVKLSAVGAAVGSPLVFNDAHGRIEEHLRAGPVPWVVLNSSFYMSNLFMASDTIRHAGQILAPAGDAKISMVDPRDVAAVACEALLGDGHEGRVYSPTGPRAITYAEAASELSTVMGRPVTFVDVSEEDAHAGLLAGGVPPWFADALIALFAELRRGVAAQTTGDVEALTGRPPRTLAEFARDHRAAFAG